MKPVTPAFGQFDNDAVDSAPEELSLVPDLMPFVPKLAPDASLDSGIKFTLADTVAAAVMIISPVTDVIAISEPLTALLVMSVPPMITVILLKVYPLSGVIAAKYVPPETTEAAVLEIWQLERFSVTG